MIHVVTKNRAERYGNQFEAMRGLLHKIYAEKRGWPDVDGWSVTAHELSPDRQASRELFIYLMRICDSGTLSAAVRLSPSELRRTHFDLPYERGFSDLPAGPDIWDAGQLCLRDQADKGQALSEIAMGTFEFALTWGIKKICVLLDHDLLKAAYQLPFHLEFGIHPFDYQGERFVPTVLPISSAAIEQLRSLVPASRPQLFLS